MSPLTDVLILYLFRYSFIFTAPSNIIVKLSVSRYSISNIPRITMDCFYVICLFLLHSCLISRKSNYKISFQRFRRKSYLSKTSVPFSMQTPMIFFHNTFNKIHAFSVMLTISSISCQMNCVIKQITFIMKLSYMRLHVLF